MHRYEEYYQRFKHIFRADEDIPQYYIPGNHDVGYDMMIVNINSLTQK